MPLKLVKRPDSPYLIMRGTVGGISIEETTGTSKKEAAEVISNQREKGPLDESIYSKAVTVTVVHTAVCYQRHGGGEKRFLKPHAEHFGATRLPDISAG